jgi:hypothetical protein
MCEGVTAPARKQLLVDWETTSSFTPGPSLLPEGLRWTPSTQNAAHLTSAQDQVYGPLPEAMGRLPADSVDLSGSAGIAAIVYSSRESVTVQVNGYAVPGVPGPNGPELDGSVGEGRAMAVASGCWNPIQFSFANSAALDSTRIGSIAIYAEGDTWVDDIYLY